jgi:hypothetical protein
MQNGKNYTNIGPKASGKAAGNHTKGNTEKFVLVGANFADCEPIASMNTTRQAKQDLGWLDFADTNHERIILTFAPISTFIV